MIDHTDPRLASLREQLEATEQLVTDERVREGQRNAYIAERLGVLSKLNRLRSLAPETRFVMRCDLPAADVPDGTVGVLGPFAGELVLAAEQQLEQIDAAIERLENED